MKIAIISDSHDNWQNVQKAISISNQEKCEFLLHAGDLIAPIGIEYLKEFKGEVKIVWGNNELTRMESNSIASESENVEYCGDFYEGTIKDIKVFMCHLPRYAEIAAETGKFSLVVHGHTHEYREETVGETILLNPGEIHGGWHNDPTFVILDTKTNTIKKIHLNTQE